MELQAENRRNVGEKNILLHKVSLHLHLPDKPVIKDRR
jgi:hypothetical protein